jgi:hypothetical protein
MKRPATRAEPADYVSVSHHLCAHCGANLTRTLSRPIDHFWSLFVPVHRYRCNRFACQWTGNFRVDGPATSTVVVTPPG